MRPSGQYRCVGCNFTFTVIDEWRVGLGFVGMRLPPGTFAAVRSLHDQ